MVSLPSGPLHHRPLPTTWLLVGGWRASGNWAWPPEHPDRLTASPLGLTGIERGGRLKVYVCVCGGGRLAVHDLGNASSAPWFSCQ